MALMRLNRALFPAIRKIQVRNFVAADKFFDRKKLLIDLKNSLRNDEVKFDEQGRVHLSADFFLSGTSEEKVKSIKTFRSRDIRSFLDEIHTHNILQANVLPDYDLLDIAAEDGVLSRRILSCDPTINLVACESSLERRIEYSKKFPTRQVLNGSPSKIPLRSGM